MPLVVLPHPTSMLLGPEAQVAARAVVAEIADVLSQDAVYLAATYADRVYPAPKRVFRAKQL